MLRKSRIISILGQNEIVLFKNILASIFFCGVCFLLDFGLHIYNTISNTSWINELLNENV